MNIAAAIVRRGVSFKVLAKSSAATGRVTVYIKAQGEKAQIIGYYHEAAELSDLVAYVKEELLMDGAC